MIDFSQVLGWVILGLATLTNFVVISYSYGKLNQKVATFDKTFDTLKSSVDILRVSIEALAIRLAGIGQTVENCPTCMRRVLQDDQERR